MQKSWDSLLGKRNMKIALAYAALQAVIWAKSAFFFAWFGHGKALQFSRTAFPPGALLFDYYFHETMHVLVAILALLFGAGIQRIRWRRLAAVVAVAVVLHDAAYWLTASHPSLLYSAQDFATDSVLLAAFIIAGYAIKKALSKREQKN